MGGSSTAACTFLKAPILSILWNQLLSAESGDYSMVARMPAQLDRGWARLLDEVLELGWRPLTTSAPRTRDTDYSACAAETVCSPARAGPKIASSALAE